MLPSSILKGKRFIAHPYWIRKQEIIDRPKMSMVMQMLQKAFIKLKPKDKLMLYSDQVGIIESHHTNRPSRKRVLLKACLDNAVMENGFGIMKTGYFTKRGLTICSRLKLSQRNISTNTIMIESNKN